MGALTVDKIVKETITICDICGGKIQEADLEDKAATAHLLGEHAIQDPEVGVTKVVKFTWPGSKRRKQWDESRAANKKYAEDARATSRPIDPDEETEPTNRYRGELRDRRYEFHADCILALIEAAIDLRVNNDKKEANDE